MTTPSTCPDCNQGLKRGAASCRCGWSAPAARSSEHGEEGHRLVCDNEGCGEPAIVREDDKNVCLRCYEGRNNTEAFERCKAMGLTNVEDMKDYCRREMRNLFKRHTDPDAWLEKIKQATVDMIVTMGTKTDELLIKKLRARCIIDANNKVIPAEKRQALRAQRAARIEDERKRAEALLLAHREKLQAMEQGTGA